MCFLLSCFSNEENIFGKPLVICCKCNCKFYDIDDIHSIRYKLCIECYNNINKKSKLAKKYWYRKIERDVV